MQIDIHKIAKLIELVSNSDVSEINLKQGEEELKITRQKEVVQAVTKRNRVFIYPYSLYLFAQIIHILL